MADGTRQATLATALNLKQIAENTLGPIPFLVLVNKADLKDQWEIDPTVLDDIEKNGIPVIKTSAKTGRAVQEAFERLTRSMMDQ